MSGFITGLYVVATPLLSALILQTAIPRTTWFATVLATLGLGVLSLNGFSIGYGELLTLASAVVYALHIVALGQAQRRHRRPFAIGRPDGRHHDLLRRSSPCPAASRCPSTTTDWLIVIYLAVIAGALTMFAQTWAQARIDASRAAVIMALEPVWAAFFAVTLGGELITVRMIIGGTGDPGRDLPGRARPATVEPPQTRSRTQR